MYHDYEPTELEMGMWERRSQGLVSIGPLTQADQDGVDKYEAYCVEQDAEYAAREAAGGRRICPKCGNRSVTSSSVLTYGVASNPNSEYSEYYQCERCDYKEL